MTETETDTAGSGSEPTVYGPATLEGTTAAVVGRRREIELVVAALMAGRHLLLEGPPGTGKSTILRAVAACSGASLSFVEGNADLTPARLAGHFDPSRVLEEGYSEDIWVDGPLLQAMRHGGLLYLEEINRVPEETLNLLVTVMSEAEVTIPRLGLVSAHPAFRLVAAMNPFDAVGTARISGAIYDRVCRVAMDYQPFEEEVAILAAAAAPTPSTATTITEKVVELVRATRDHPEVRVGSSIRGGIDQQLLARDLTILRQVAPSDNEAGLDAALTALSGRLRLHDSSTSTPEAIITELWEAIMAPPEAPDPTDDAGQDEGSAGKDHRRKAAPSNPTTTRR